MGLGKIKLTLEIILSSVFLISTCRGAGVDLHAHLFMKSGMGWVFRGDFFEPIKATNWKNRLSSQINVETLNRSSLDIVVASLYAHPLFSGSVKQAIREQISMARRFVRENPEWILANHPKQAQAALKNKQRVLILALEGASGVLDSEADLKEFVDEGQIRIVTLLHLTDDHFGGAAFLNGPGLLANPFSWLSSMAQGIRDQSGLLSNKYGLTEKGTSLAKALISRSVWIDLAHASDASLRDLQPLLKDAHHPFLYTHTVLRKYLKAERGIKTEDLKQVASTGGVVGLMPSEAMLVNTPGTPCALDGGIHSFARQFLEVSEIVGEKAVLLGSDFNGAIPHLKPSCKVGTSLDQDGYWNIGQTPDLWKTLGALHVTHPEYPETSTRYFLESWETVFSKASDP